MDLYDHDIKYSTIEQQIEKLKSQGLVISDESFAKSQLKCYGYSNLITTLVPITPFHAGCSFYTCFS